MENRDIAALLQLLLDLETAGSGDVLQVYAAEGACQQSDGIHDIVHILAPHAERNRVHITEGLEQDAFTLHNRHTGFRSDIAQTQDCGTVGHYGYGVPAAGQLVALIDVLLNLQTGLCDTRCISKRKSLLAVYGSAGSNLQLAFPFIV